MNADTLRWLIDLFTAKIKEFEESAKNRPKVVCLCGSTRFREAFEGANRAETLAGNIVLSVGLFGHHEGLDMAGETKARLDDLHLRKIDLADEVLILNVGGYIGESTRRELEYASGAGRAVRFLEPPSFEQGL